MSIVGYDMPEMTVEEAIEWGKTLSFEKVWAGFMENRKQFAETDRKMAETDRKIAELTAQSQELKAEEAKRKEEEVKWKEKEAKWKEKEAKWKEEEAERKKELDRLTAENKRQFAETSRMIKELTKNVSGVNNTLGKWSEDMVAAQLWKKFNIFGYKFSKGGPRAKFCENNKIIAEVDVFLENGDFVMAVETKVELKPKDVDDHIERIKKVRQYMDRRNDKRIIIGAMAGAIVSDSARDYTLNNGLYVIKQSGESIALVEPPQDFSPRKWTAA